ncbi:hypothetical protein AAIB46_10070 [Streptomyces sp. 35M1]|uniref:hypothetical protein n=1 Tax=Streptomyces sp. 35M1 TaxID=3142978 RepID=UPI003990C829
MSTRTEALDDAAEWLASIGEEGAAYLLRTCDVPVGVRVEKDTRAARAGESTHRAPCEFPEVLPCRCPARPRGLSEASVHRARQRARAAAYFQNARLARARTSGGAR